jgi:hypothetical protein
MAWQIAIACAGAVVVVAVLTFVVGPLLYRVARPTLPVVMTTTRCASDATTRHVQAPFFGIPWSFFPNPQSCRWSR